jgi:hypothetical protein
MTRRAVRCGARPPKRSAPAQYAFAHSRGRYLRFWKLIPFCIGALKNSCLFFGQGEHIYQSSLERVLLPLALTSVPLWRFSPNGRFQSNLAGSSRSGFFVCSASYQKPQVLGVQAALRLHVTCGNLPAALWLFSRISGRGGAAASGGWGHLPETAAKSRVRRDTTGI